MNYRMPAKKKTLIVMDLRNLCTVGRNRIPISGEVSLSDKIWELCVVISLVNDVYMGVFSDVTS